LVVTTSWDKTARIWNLATRELVLELPKESKGFDGHDGPVRSAAFSPDGELVVTASGKKARIWRINGRCQTSGCETLSDPESRGRSALLRTLQGHREQVMTASFDHTGQRLITASLDGTVRLWDVATGETLQILQGPKVASGNRASAALSPDGRAVVAAFADTWAYLWDIMSRPSRCRVCLRKVTSVAASPDISPAGR
jgi:WD40 repeat protein